MLDLVEMNKSETVEMELLKASRSIIRNSGRDLNQPDAFLEG